MNECPIGMFDSGVGGLGIAKAIRELLPLENIVFLADSKNCPYGIKIQSEIEEIASTNADYLINEHKAKIVIIACNTATVSTISFLRQKYPHTPFIGVVPVIKTAVNLTRSGEIAVLATPRTLASLSYKELLNEYAKNTKVWDVFCPGLAELIEQNTNIDAIEKLLRDVLEPIKNRNYDVVVLGCTHYTLVEDSIRRVLGNQVILLDSNGAVARNAKQVLTNENLLSGGPGHLTVKVNGDVVTVRAITQSIALDCLVDRLN